KHSTPHVSGFHRRTPPLTAERNICQTEAWRERGRGGGVRSGVSSPFTRSRGSSAFKVSDVQTKASIGNSVSEMTILLNFWFVEMKDSHKSDKHTHRNKGNRIIHHTLH